MRAAPFGRITPCERARSISVVRDHASPPRSLVACTELIGLLGGAEWSHHRPVEYSFGPQVRPPDDGLPATELVRELGLQAAEGGGRVRFRLLRRELHQKAAGRSC